MTRVTTASVASTLSPSRGGATTHARLDDPFGSKRDDELDDEGET